MTEKDRAQEIIEIMEEALSKFGVSEIMDQSLKEVIQFRQLLNQETDRGCALMAAAYLEVSLEKLIKKYLVQDSKLHKAIFSSKGNGILSSFSSKIDIAFLLGLITSEVKRDLDLLRRIRNDFAHSPAQLTFESQSIKNRCEQLLNDGVNPVGNPRDKFTGAMMRIDGELYATSLDIMPLSERKDIDLETKNVFKRTFLETVAKIENN